ncbi:MAG TPA: DUF3604 domain-containing protein [Chloroflexota bacterium]|nr:DUF3604 domain-containing protein [Chloroflexota bacterium]
MANTASAPAPTLTEAAYRAQLPGFAASPALARTGSELLLAYLSFDGAAECVRFARSGNDGESWSAPVDLSAAGAVFQPALATIGEDAWVAWVARDAGAAPAEHATFSLLAAPCHPERGGGPVTLAGGAPHSDRPFAPVMAAGSDTVWLVHESWQHAEVAADQPVILQLHRLRGNTWEAPVDVPVPLALTQGGRAPRMYDPAIAAGADGAVHVLWWSPNAGEAWKQPGSRAGTTADDLASLDMAERLGSDDASATGSDVWHTRYEARSERWSEPERLNYTSGWHLHPSATVDATGRLWASWAAVTRQEIYPELTSDIPYVQTGRARAKRAMWFREARPVVRVRDGNGPWRVMAGGAGGADGNGEQGTVEGAGHSLFPTLVPAGSSVALVVRRYGAWQKTEINTGERLARLRAFETAVLWPDSRAEGGWSAPYVLHEPEQGGVLARPSATSLSDRLLIGWQADLGTRNTQSDVCLAAISIKEGDTKEFGQAVSTTVENDSASTRLRPRKRTALFGNIHMHTEQSFCRRPTSYLLDFNYRWAQDCMRQDFAVLTDHAETKSAYEWWLNRKTAAFFTTPAFAALLGYEWTTRYDPETGEGHGHLDVYFRGDPPRFWPANAIESSTVTGLWDLLQKGETEGYPAFTVAHHPSVHNFRRNWTSWGEETYEPVVEIHQDRRGSFERPGATGGAVLAPDQYVEGHYVSDALARGYRMGFVSGGDHMGISMTAVPAPTGARVTREAIFDAIRSRRCYAVTGAKIGLTLDIEVTGDQVGQGARATMGQEVPLREDGTTIRASAQVDAPSAVRRTVLVHNGQDLLERGGQREGGRLTAVLDTELVAKPGDHCYVRVELANGEIAWSSPIFFVAMTPKADDSTRGA